MDENADNVRQRLKEMDERIAILQAKFLEQLKEMGLAEEEDCKSPAIEPSMRN
jgi:hypothetical protein